MSENTQRPRPGKGLRDRAQDAKQRLREQLPSMMRLRVSFSIGLGASALTLALILLYLPSATAAIVVALAVSFAFLWADATEAPAPALSRTITGAVVVAAVLSMIATNSLKTLVLVLGCIPFAVFFGEMLRGRQRDQMVTSLGVNVLGAMIGATGSLWVLIAQTKAAPLGAIALILGLVATAPGFIIRNHYWRIAVNVLTAIVLAIGYHVVANTNFLAHGLVVTPTDEPGAVFLLDPNLQISVGLGLVIAVALVAAMNSIAMDSVGTYLRRAPNPVAAVMGAIAVAPVLLAAVSTYLVALLLPA